MNPKKQARRDAMGDPSGISQSNATFAGAPPPPQPRPFMPQDQRGGNVTNNPHFDNGEGNTGQMIGGRDSFMYGDMGLPPQEAMAKGMRGVVGPLTVSGEAQGIGQSYGLRANQGMNTYQQPKEETARMLEGMHHINDAMTFGQKLGFGNRPDGSMLPTPYEPGPMGLHAKRGPLEGGETESWQNDFQTPQQSINSLGLQGMQSAEAAVQTGMNMGTGQRNTKA